MYNADHMKIFCAWYLSLIRNYFILSKEKVIMLQYPKLFLSSSVTIFTKILFYVTVTRYGHI